MADVLWFTAVIHNPRHLRNAETCERVSFFSGMRRRIFRGEAIPRHVFKHESKRAFKLQDCPPSRHLLARSDSSFQHTGHLADHLRKVSKLTTRMTSARVSGSSQMYRKQLPSHVILRERHTRVRYDGTGPCARERSRSRRTTRLFWFLNSTLRALFLMCHGVRRVLQTLA